MDYNNFKRKTREMPKEVRQKISASLMGHQHTEETRQKISAGQKKAWARIPRKTDETKPIGFGEMEGK